MWADCIIAFDASALLDLYRITPDTREEFFTVLEQTKERVWLPHQAGLEYYDNRAEVVRTGEASFGQIAQLAKDAANEFRKRLDVYRQYRWIDADRWAALVDKAATDIGDALGREPHPLQDYLNADPIEQRLNALFHDKVGKPFVDMHEIYDRADRRVQLSVPPGFADIASKKDFHKYGDVVLWFQLLDFARTEHKNIVLVTSDAKKDWWLRENGKTLGPRSELVQEMYAVAGVWFHMYAPHRFLEYAQKHLQLEGKAPNLQKAAQEFKQVEMEKSAELERTQRVERYGRALEQLRTMTAPSIRFQEEYGRLREQLEPMMESYVKLGEQLRRAFQPLAQVTAEAPPAVDRQRLADEAVRVEGEQRGTGEADLLKEKGSSDGGGAERDEG